MFKNKTLLITGGTGSFGNAVLDRFLQSNINEIRIFSRDEKKQDDMRKHYKNPKLKFYLGDVREKESVQNAMRGVDYVFHAAALKQVPSCEFYPMQAVFTNILGTENVLSAAISEGVHKVVCLSTDKAVYPINAMGISKAMMEKVMIASSRNLENTGTIICGTRYGNVMFSRGSVIPLFIDQIISGKPITVTNIGMTRFMMTLIDAVDLVLYAFKNGKNGEIFVQKSPAATLDILIKALLKIFQKTDYEINQIGTRHGEKIYEVLLGREEMLHSDDLGKYYRINPDSRDLNYEKYYEKGCEISNQKNKIEEYNSHNTDQLNLPLMIKLLKQSKPMHKLLNLQKKCKV